MMVKFHIRVNGEPGRCYAKTKCRLGGESGSENHFDTPEEAREAFEKQSSESQTVTLTKKSLTLDATNTIDAIKISSAKEATTKKLEALGLDSSIVSEEEKDLYSELVSQGYSPVTANSLGEGKSPLLISGDQLVSQNRNSDWVYNIPEKATFEITQVEVKRDYIEITTEQNGGGQLFVEVKNDAVIMVNSEDNHYKSDEYDFKKENAKNQEVRRLDKLEKAARIDRALEVPLEYSGPTPKWLEKMQETSIKAHPNVKPPRIIDVIDSPAGKLAVVWKDQSLKDIDKRVQNERGFVIRETSLVSMETGDDLGHVKVEFVDDESAKRSFGDDEWSSMRYMEEYGGSTFGMTDYKEVKSDGLLDNSGSKSKVEYEKVNNLDVANSLEEKISSKRAIWAASHKALSLTPTSMRELPYDSRVEYYNLNASHSPISEDEIDKDLKEVRKITDKKYKNFKKDYKIPFVDFSRTQDAIKGTGLGSAMYVYTSRMLGKENKILRGSGLQSDSATGVWSRFTKNEKLPIDKMTHKWSNSETTESYYLDFRDKK